MLNHDSSWYLVATSKWLHGARLYSDIMEINPPLSLYLTAPPVALAEKASLSPELLFIAWVCGLASISLYWARRLIHNASLGFYGHWIVAAAFIVLLIVPIANFGQREHLLIIFVLPYLLYQAFLPPATLSERSLIAIFATFGLFLKPYFLLLPLFIGLFRAFQERKILVAFTLEHWIFALAWIAYLGVIVWVYPDYFSNIVPLGLLVYGAYDISTTHVVSVPGFIGIATLTIAIVILHATHSTTPRERNTTIVLLASTLAFTIAYLIQWKGWEYQRIPIYSTLCLTLMWTFVISTRYLATTRSGLRGATLFALGVTVVSLLPPIVSGPYRNFRAVAFKKFLPLNPSQRIPITVFTTEVSASFPFANDRRVDWIGRYPALWIIPGAIRRLNDLHDISPRIRAALEAALDYARTTTVDDVLRTPPDLIFIDIRKPKPYFGEIPFDYVLFFEHDPRFAAFWKCYHDIGRSLGFQVWNREQTANCRNDLRSTDARTLP